VRRRRSSRRVESRRRERRGWRRGCGERDAAGPSVAERADVDDQRAPRDGHAPPIPHRRQRLVAGTRQNVRVQDEIRLSLQPPEDPDAGLGVLARLGEPVGPPRAGADDLDDQPDVAGPTGLRSSSRGCCSGQRWTTTSGCAACPRRRGAGTPGAHAIPQERQPAVARGGRPPASGAAGSAVASRRARRRRARTAARRPAACRGRPGSSPGGGRAERRA
jgi:hypothetical protein